MDRLIEDLWDAPPDGAAGAIQTFVSALRQALEPDRASRAPAQLLVTMAPGYALRAACLHAIELDDHPTMDRLYAELQPAADELAGAGSGPLTLRPVAHYLGDLATALGRSDQAANHYRQTLAVASRAGAPHWTDAARSALAGLPDSTPAARTPGR